MCSSIQQSIPKILEFQFPIQCPKKAILVWKIKDPNDDCVRLQIRGQRKEITITNMQL